VDGASERKERRAHRGGGSMCGGGAEATQWCLEAGGFSMAGNDTTIVLHLGGERERKLRWGSNQRKEARASGSPRG
jgi:hypothetical protein